MPVINGSCTLNYISTVDTSTAHYGVSMFSLSIQSSVLVNANIIQFEYQIRDVSENVLKSGFIELENAVQTQGVSNQFTIAVPSQSNVANPGHYVVIRAYLGSTTSNQINTTEFTNSLQLYNAPAKAIAPLAYISYGESGTYYYDDLLYVEIDNNTSYDLDEVQFIVSYSYKNETNDNTWTVSEPVNGTVVTMGGNTKIVLDSISLQSDVKTGTPIHVSVNAIYKYTANSLNYYTVSEISDTVTATNAEPTAPVLESIEIPDDYLVYANNLQQIKLKWSTSPVGLIPGYGFSSFNINVYNNDTLIETIVSIPSTTTEYTYIIPSQYTNPSSSSKMSFSVTGVSVNGSGNLTSNEEQVNTFTKATQPTLLVTNWANTHTGSNGIDISSSWRNPVNTGQSLEVIDFYVEVLDSSSNIVHTHTVTYNNAPDYVYVLLMSDVDTTSAGNVRVSLRTRDTNANTETGEYDTINGISAITAYIASDVPQIINVERDSYNNLDFEVITEVALGEINQFSYFNGSEYVIVQFMSYTVVGDYTVSQTQIDSGDLKYTFSFSGTWLDNNELNDAFLISCSNATGIGSKHVSVN